MVSGCPQIVMLHDVFEEPDHTFLVLGCMRGGDLIERINQKQHYTEPEAREVCKQLLLGVEYMHNKRIANRNLKPENILLVSCSTACAQMNQARVCDHRLKRFFFFCRLE